MSALTRKAQKAILHPHRIPAYLKRRLDEKYLSLDATRIIWPEPGRAVLADVSLNRPIGQQVLALTHATLVSPGTERAFFNGQPNARVTYPYLPGYSGAGTVVDVGPDVVRFKPGDRVAGPFPHASAVLFTECQLTPLPADVDLIEASFLQLGVIALQGVRKAKIQLGERVAIIGLGLIGLLATQIAVRAGAHPVLAFAWSDARLPLATRFGAGSSMSLAKGDVCLSQIEADVTIDATGNPGALETALECTRDGGRVVLLGSARGVSRGLDLACVARRGIQMIGAHVDSLGVAASSPGLWTREREEQTFLRMLSRGWLDLRPLVSDELLPSEPELFYRRLSRSDRSILGAIFHWDRLPDAERLAERLPASVAAAASVLPVRWSLSMPEDFGTSRRVAETTTTHASTGNGSPTRSGQSAPLPVTDHALARQGQVLRVGLIGCGEIALQTAAALHGSEATHIVMASDVNAAVAADMGRRYQVPFTTSVEELLARSDVDAVLVSVPHFLHAPLAIQAAESGKHVMVEKPMATSLADADRMIEAARRAGVKLSVVYCQRYLSHVQQAKGLIERGALGKILGIQVTLMMDKPPSYFSSGFSGRVHSDWRTSREKSGGGILAFNLVHYLDIIRYLTGLEARRVSAELGALDTPTETEDTISVSLRYANNAIGTIVGTSVVRGASYQPRIQLWGSDGQIILHEPDNFSFYSLHQVDERRPGNWHRLAPTPFGGDRQAYVTRFARSVFANDRPEVSGEDGRAIQAIVDAIYRAGEGQTTVSLGEEVFA